MSKAIEAYEELEERNIVFLPGFLSQSFCTFPKPLYMPRKEYVSIAKRVAEENNLTYDSDELPQSFRSNKKEVLFIQITAFDKPNDKCSSKVGIHGFQIFRSYEKREEFADYLLKTLPIGNGKPKL